MKEIALLLLAGAALLSTNVAAEETVGREEQDAWALRSHMRAIAAQEAGLFTREIASVEIATSPPGAVA